MAALPATEKQLAYLQALLREAGYDGFRDARRPLGLTQRQGSGKFTRAEASALIDRLIGDDTPSQSPLPGVAAPVAEPPPDQVEPAATAVPEVRLADVSAEALAAELTSRGWSVTPPT
jgi:hypothetical protein